MNSNLKEVAQLFFKLGIIAFGGPAAHISMMEEEVVTKKKWMSREHFLDLMGATNLIPGPNSTEMTMHCGYHRAGVAGLFVAGICFIFPAVLLTGILAYFYVEYGEIPEVESLLYGIKPAVLAIILGAIYKLGKKALKNWQLGIIGAIVLIANFMGLTEVLAILGGGLLGIIWFNLIQKNTLNSAAPFFFLWFFNTISEVNSWKLFLVFFKVGAVLFGSGYVLVAYLDGELVEGLGWLTRSELLDAIAIGQFTPGPVLSTATFIGYQINGVGGAIAATVGIFLPSFFFVWFLNPLISKLRSSKIASSFLDAVNISAVAIMIVVTYQLGESVLIDWKAWLIALLACAIYFNSKKVSVLWIVIGAAIFGYLLEQVS